MTSSGDERIPAPPLRAEPRHQRAVGRRGLLRIRSRDQLHRPLGHFGQPAVHDPGPEPDPGRKGPDPECLLLELRLDADPGGPAHRPIRRTGHVRCLGADLVVVHRGHGWCVELRTLLALRLGLGVGEAGAYPAAAKTVSHWFPFRLRGRATSVYDSGARIGSAAATPVIALIIGLWGWHAAFLFAGGIGVLWAIGWWAWYRRPENKAGVNDAELEIIHESHRAERQQQPRRAADEDPSACSSNGPSGA